MVHRVSILRNPRIILLLAGMLAMPAAAILVLLYLQWLAGLVALAVTVWLDIGLARTLRTQLRSSVATTEGGLTVVSSDGTTIEIPWKRLTAAGLSTQRGNPEMLFLYEKKKGRLLVVPAVYGRLAELERAIRAHAAFHRLQLGPGEKLEDRVFQLLHY
jgi:hypothetical protein